MPKEKVPSCLSSNFPNTPAMFRDQTWRLIADVAKYRPIPSRARQWDDVVAGIRLDLCQLRATPRGNA